MGCDSCHRAWVAVCAGRGTVCQKPTLGIPMEKPNEKWHPIGFTSKSLSPVERNYTIYDKELLLVIHGLEQWRHKLEGTKHTIEILNDH